MGILDRESEERREMVVDAAVGGGDWRRTTEGIAERESEAGREKAEWLR